MATVRRFEDLLCFKKSRELVKAVYGALHACRDQGFKDQIQRASVSIMSNIAEGFESGTRAGFLSYLYIAKASAGEVRAQTYVAHDVGYVNVQTFKDLHGRAEECSRLLSSFIKAVKTSEHAGLLRKTEPNKRSATALEFEKEMQAELAKILPHIYGKKDSKI
jgi:four helix bundle protein